MSKTGFSTPKVLSAATVVVLLIAGALSHAENKQAGIASLYTVGRLEWKHVDGHMSDREYQEAARHNQRTFGKAARQAFETTLTSYGISKQGVQMAGAAVGLAIKGAKLDLNESETLTLQVSDVVTDNRAVFFNIKLDW